jgi:hypothetical protein
VGIARPCQRDEELCYNLDKELLEVHSRKRSILFAIFLCLVKHLGMLPSKREIMYQEAVDI